ncbi:MAG: IclR family transcriptional regulator [Verrucomicrobiaceae bacterium]|nr:MAG: IclR family transcriptional regulator [Verrucomicrobiaceae bacterium]
MPDHPATSSRKPCRGKYSVPAVDQMLDIVEHLARKPHSCGITELARELGISTNGVFRILKCLTKRGYTEVDPAGGYRLGTQFFTLGLTLQSRFEIFRRARVHLERLCEESGETVQLHALREDRALVLDCVTPASASVLVQVLPGSLMEPHASAFSMAVLAFLPATEARRHLPRKLKVLTPHTITDKKKLLEEFARIRTAGLAYDRENYILGFYCIGAPVFDALGKPVAGVGVTGLVSLFHPGTQRKIGKMVLGCAEKISRDIGYSGDRYTEWKKQ